jgi:lysosomal alpha-mannosidase
MYSTPLCYLKSLNDQGLEWPTKNDDFFPYASDNHAYWTGYFTSRPNSKRFIREASSWLQFAKQLTSRTLIKDMEKVTLNDKKP